MLTTHYLEEAEVLADRVGVIVCGRMIEIGDVATLGGRQEAGAIVRWHGPNGPEQRSTHTATALIAELAAAFDGENLELTVSRPSLEDVYLTMIGENR